MLDNVSTVITIAAGAVTFIGAVYAIYRRSVNSEKKKALKEQEKEVRFKRLETALKNLIKGVSKSEEDIEKIEEAIHKRDIKETQMVIAIKTLSSSQKDLGQDLKEILKILLERG